MARGAGRVKDLGPVLGALASGGCYNVERLREISGLRTRFRSSHNGSVFHARVSDPLASASTWSYVQRGFWTCERDEP